MTLLSKTLGSKLYRDQIPRLFSAKISLYTLLGISIYSTNINYNNSVIWTYNVVSGVVITLRPDFFQLFFFIKIAM